MKRKLINSQLSNFSTYNMYVRQLQSIALNVFILDNIPDTLNKRYINKTLLNSGKIAFFKDDVLGLVALPFEDKDIIKDIYDEPKIITVRANNGYHLTLKNKDDFVIMYDNNLRISLWLDILQYAERLSLCMRTSDINISQQRTNRFWKTKNENLKSVTDTINSVDTFSETIITYENLDLDDTTACLSPAEYVVDKIDMHYEKLWNEFLRLVGVANLSYTKKERNIRDEIQAMQGGTIASRINRYEPRLSAVKEINEKFGTDIKVKYYDGIPNSEKEESNDDTFISNLSDDEF